MRYDIVIIGATMEALGLAKTVKGALKPLILNKTEMVAYEFINSFKLPRMYTEGSKHYKEFKDLGIDILLKTEILEINKCNEGYNIEIFNGAGFQTIFTKVVVDTTLEREFEIISKSLNCLLVNQNRTKFPDTDLSGVAFLDDSDEKFNTVIMKYDCDISMSLYEARHQLIDFWRNRPSILNDWKIASIGFAFEEKAIYSNSKKDENYFIAPSVYFDSPTLSLEAGMALGRSLIL